MGLILLATDLDDTLVGDDNSTQVFNGLVSRMRDQQKIKLVYITGRSPESYDQLKNERSLLEPDALVTAVGTEIFLDGKTKYDNWPMVAEWNSELIRHSLLNVPSLEEQPKTEQRQFKISYYLRNNQSSYELVKKILRHHPVDVVYSMGLYLDIVPRGVNKGSALRLLADRWHIEAEDIIACGDSANDISMLKRNKAIIVGNAKEELLRWALQAGNENIFLAKGFYAQGIIEGFAYYGV